MNDELIRKIAANVRRRLDAEGQEETAGASAAEPGHSVYFAPWTGIAFEPQPALHPSQERFDVGEAVESVRELVDFLEAQRCTIEKDKPCDHCGACRVLGF